VSDGIFSVVYSLFVDNMRSFFDKNCTGVFSMVVCLTLKSVALLHDFVCRCEICRPVFCVCWWADE